MNNTPVKLQGGKLYSKVVDRLRAFRADYPSSDGWTIQTHIHTLTDDYVIFECHISSPDQVIVSTGHGFNGIAKEKGLEKAETVSVGRALAFFDPMYGGDYELASSDEMEKFNSNTTSLPVPPVNTPPQKPIGNGVDQLVDRAIETMKGNGDEKTIPFGKYTGTPLQQLPGDYVEWLLTKMDNLDDDLRTALNEVYQAKRPQIQG